MKKGRIASLLVWTILLGGGGARVEARTLSDQIDFLFGERGIQLDVRPIDPRFPPHTAHFSDASLATLGLLVKQLAPSAADFPSISTVPGFTYRYNSQLQVFERSSASLGPMFVERPQTLGRRKFDLGVTYLFADFAELDGQDLDRLAFRGLPHNDCCSNPPSPGDPVFEIDTADLFVEKLTLRSHVVSFFATYGLTDRWDVNLLLPVVFTSLDLRARAQVNNESGTSLHFFANDVRIVEQVRSVDDDKTGVGDLLLRTKYHLFDAQGFNLSSGFVLRLPVGEEDDFQGLGDTTLTSFVTLAQEYGRLDVHASGGIELNFDDSDRSRVRYAAGITLPLFERLAFLIDVIGSSNLTTDRVSVRVPQFFDPPPAPPTSFVRASTTLSTDIIDLAVGFKANLIGSVVGFANVFVPLNDDGLRAEVIPVAGLEVSF